MSQPPLQRCLQRCLLYVISPIDHSNKDLISYEQIGYLFKREVGYAKSIAEDKYTPGTLISFQEGAEGDPFDEVNEWP